MLSKLRFLCFATLIIIQNGYSTNLDSLKSEVHSDKADTLKVLDFKALWRAYINEDLDSALYYAHEGAQLAKNINYPRGIADLTVYEAFVHAQKGNSDIAFSILKSELANIQTNYDFKSGEIFILQWIANLYRDLNQVDSTSQYLTELIEKSNKVHFKSQIGSHLSAAQFYQQQKYYNVALYHYQIVDSICRVNEVNNNSCTACKPIQVSSSQRLMI